ncbi:DivIVA domain-containing protein [Sphaerisporangium siamense]|uniref:DivIVA domain-containing protein n=1 Tax=Sphaerisporangium siamense TaxID=795645 RepID=A0A7W7GDF3_9ACTN|nr:DivIVA domain-containing protein [Sphaerisporangium siamense]MBB4705517.1 DivIVA domain-containing protein [Sphaerisporangium siamense]
MLAVRTGYDPDQVDALIRRIEATLGRGTLEGPPVTPDEIRMAGFGVRRGGYNELAVDYALDAFLVAVETLAARAPAPAAMPWPPIGTAPPRAVPAPHGFPHAGTFGAAAVSPAEEDAPTLPGMPAQRMPPPEAVPEEPATWLEAQAARVERVLFRAGRLGAGYDEDQVDVFLDRVVATLRGTTDRPLTGDQVRAAAFDTVMFRPGYAVVEVDAFLAEVAGVLDRHDAERPAAQAQRVPQE